MTAQSQRSSALAIMLYGFDHPLNEGRREARLRSELHRTHSGAVKDHPGRTHLTPEAFVLHDDDIAAALAAAEAALRQDDAVWITQSALRERAYFYGLYDGLSAIAPKSQLQSVLSRALLNTMFVRPGDEGFDHFPESPLGNTYARFRDELHAFLGEKAPAFPEAALEALRACSSEIEHRRRLPWVAVQATLSRVRDLGRQASKGLTLSDDARRELAEACDGLGHLLRAVDAPPQGPV